VDASYGRRIRGMGEATYTLREADRVLRERECARLNHDWDIVERIGVGPVLLVCSRCGDSRRVLPRD